MIRFEALEGGDGSGWDAALEACPEARVYHSSSWLRFLEHTQGGKVLQARILEEGATVGYFCGRIIRKYGLRILGSPLPGWTTHYMGPVFVGGRSATRELLAALDRWVFRELGCHHFEFLWRSTLPQEFRTLGYGAVDLPSSLIDLRIEPERIFRGFNKGCRWSVRKAEREGLTVEEAGGSEFVAEYYRQLRDVFAKQGLVPTYPESRVRSLFADLPSANLLGMRVLTAQGECAATAIVTRDRHWGYLWGAASWRRHQKHCPNELIQWRLMLRLKELGVSEYDFGGGGAYKSKYGGAPIVTPWYFKSRNPILGGLRTTYRSVVRARQRIRGWLGPAAGGWSRGKAGE